MQVIPLSSPYAPVDLKENRSITIGNFDGCHLGHQSLIKSAKEAAEKFKISSSALSFNPHPEAFFMRQETKSDQLFTLKQKVRAMSELGLDQVFIQTFNENLSSMHHDEFIDKYLCHHLKCRSVVVGGNFKFGFKRLGTSDYLKSKFESRKFHVNICEAEKFEDSPVSSTRIRKALNHNGSVEEAQRMLGRPYMLEGVVSRGDQLGRKIGFPTMNLESIEQLIPADGVYVGWAWISSRSKQKNPSIMVEPDTTFLTMINIGTRPTIEGQSKQLRVEAHVIGLKIEADELYDQRVALYFGQRLRSEMAFPSVEHLKTQLQRDRGEALSRRSSLRFRV